MNIRNSEMAIAAASTRGLMLVLGAVVVAAVVYVIRFVGPYISLNPAYYDYFWPWRYALWAHLAGGVTALLVGPIFASELLGLACAWTVTTGRGYLAIRGNHRDQHREWMIRSYVVASAFVVFRVFVDLLHAAGVHGPTRSGTPEELKIAAWLCWAVPL